MDQYKKLTINTVILMIGSMGSRIISILMLPFYTNILTTAEYGTIDLLMQTNTLLMPICTIGMSSGVLRFGLDKNYRRRDVFSSGLLGVAAGFVFCLLFIPIASYLPIPIKDEIKLYGLGLLTLVLSSNLHSVCNLFVRSQEKVRIYAFGAILNTICNVLLMILFLRILRMGVAGYLLAVTLADAIASLFLTAAMRLWRFVGFIGLRISTLKEMLKFSAPTIPSTISWWLMSMADRFMIKSFISVAATGIYSLADKIPSMISVISNVFINAWQISIMKTEGKREQTLFYSKMTGAYQAILFVAASCVTLFSRLIITLLASPDYYEAWIYVPLLVSAAIFSCLSAFVGNIYTLEKKSVPHLITTLIGASSNILLNWLLLPRHGVNGAVFATLSSFALLFSIRMIHTRRYIKLSWSPAHFICCTALLLIQNIIMITYWGPVYLIQAVCLLIILLLNYKPILTVLKRVLSKNEPAEPQ